MKHLLTAVFLLLASPAFAVSDSFEGRDITLTQPQNLPPAGQRALVVVLHGGGGNSDHIQRNLGMDAVAEKHGFMVAYLNGTRAGKLLPARMRAWNAGGGCCGLPEKSGVDDISYIVGAARYIQQKYGIDPNRIYGMGHSNGAIMTQTLICKAGLYSAAVPISGPLNIGGDCPAARVRHIVAVHGENDLNVPISGGFGTKGVTDIDFRSQAYSQQVFTQYGATYQLDAVQGADHALTHIDTAIRKRDGISLAEKAAEFFGLTKP